MGESKNTRMATKGSQDQTKERKRSEKHCVLSTPSLSAGYAGSQMIISSPVGEAWQIGEMRQMTSNVVGMLLFILLLNRSGEVLWHSN